MSDLTAFQAWPKTPRLFRDCVVTEKIDGTNAAVMIRPFADPAPHEVQFMGDDGILYCVGAQSRNRLIWPGKQTDNAGFAAWVHAHAVELVHLLGQGRHFGEWWGKGIQRNYGLDHKRFSLFNTERYADVEVTFADGTVINTVPEMYRGTLDFNAVLDSAAALRAHGSAAAPGFMDPEGVCVYHVASKQVFKYTLDGDGHKGSKD